MQEVVDETSVEIYGYIEKVGEIATQIDLLIHRMDNIVNMCEIKFYNDLFSVDNDYYKVMQHRELLLEKYLKKGMGIRPTLITAYGLAYSRYSSIFTNVITLDALFC